MALTHLLDTSVLTRLRQPAIRAALEGKAEWGQLARAGISDLEIGYSARSDSEWGQLAEALEELGKIELLEERDAMKLEQVRNAQADLAEAASGVQQRVAS